MREYADDDIRAARAPIASLKSKSEKARLKLSPGTWQHTMLSDNIFALQVAEVLMADDAEEFRRIDEDDLRTALRAFGSMIERTEKAGAKFAPGTSQHSLQRNRLTALRIAQTITQAELDKR